MIISASRRTDIPAYYTPWLLNRLREGFCLVPNPFNHKQITRVSLQPKDVDVLVFWTRNPRPLFPFLNELDGRDYHYFFQYTMVDYPPILEPHRRNLSTSIETFRAISDRIGSGRVIWRYDPIILSNHTDVHFHIERYRTIARSLSGYTHHSVISLFDSYRKLKPALKSLNYQGFEIDPEPDDGIDRLMPKLASIAHENGMSIRSCAEGDRLSRYGINPGKCIDDALIESELGIVVSSRKDPGQRELCACAISKDIGVYNTCIAGCRYCYATSHPERAKLNYANHNPEAPVLGEGY